MQAAAGSITLVTSSIRCVCDPIPLFQPAQVAMPRPQAAGPRGAWDRPEICDMNNLPGTPLTDQPPLALRPREAAAAMGIGRRKLWEITAARTGGIPHVRVGRSVL